MITAQVQVTNTGDMAGDEVIQLYVGKEDSAVDRPVRELKGFTVYHYNPVRPRQLPLQHLYQSLNTIAIMIICGSLKR